MGIYLKMPTATRAEHQQRMLTTDHKLGPDHRLSPNHHGRAERNFVCVGTWGAGHAKRLRTSVSAQSTSKRCKYLKREAEYCYRR